MLIPPGGPTVSGTCLEHPEDDDDQDDGNQQPDDAHDLPPYLETWSRFPGRFAHVARHSSVSVLQCPSRPPSETSHRVASFSHPPVMTSPRRCFTRVGRAAVVAIHTRRAANPCRTWRMGRCAGHREHGPRDGVLASQAMAHRGATGARLRRGPASLTEDSGSRSLSDS